MNSPLAIIFVCFALVNLFAFFIMWRDKVRSATRGAERIPEGLLFFMAVAFGSLGVFAGMFSFHHKTGRWYFLLGIPLAFMENLALLYVVGGHMLNVPGY